MKGDDEQTLAAKITELGFVESTDPGLTGMRIFVNPLHHPNLCQLCHTPLREHFQRECLPCFELRTRIERHPDLARKILRSMEGV